MLVSVNGSASLCSLRTEGVSGEVHEDELPPVVMEHGHSCCQLLRSGAPSCPPARRSRCTRQGREDLEPILVALLRFWVLASTGTSDLRRLLGHVEVHQGRDFHGLSCLGCVRVQPAHVEDRCIRLTVPLLIVVLTVLHAVGLVLAARCCSMIQPYLCPCCTNR